MTLVESDGLHPVHAIATDAGVLPSAALYAPRFHDDASDNDTHGSMPIAAILPVQNMREATNGLDAYSGGELFRHLDGLHQRSVVLKVGDCHCASPRLRKLTQDNVPQAEWILNRLPLHGHVKFLGAA